MKTFVFTFMVAAAPLLANACSSTSTSGAGGATTACSMDADCGAARVCGFAESAACSAKGQCFPAPGAVCQAYSPGCACDGSEINIACTGLPQGYASKPLAHAGACADAGSACTTDTDCGAAKVCGFAESGGCSAKGQCFPKQYAICQAYSPGCACDGTMINIVCTGLPQGYVSKPLAHAGACGDGGCIGDNICLSTVHCTSNADCSAIGSTCDVCLSLCGCGSNAGNCCPSAWSLHSCAYPDGGTGLACHDPAMGCASSTTCGQGCDAIVVGACDGG